MLATKEESRGDQAETVSLNSVNSSSLSSLVSTYQKRQPKPRTSSSTSATPHQPRRCSIEDGRVSTTPTNAPTPPLNPPSPTSAHNISEVIPLSRLLECTAELWYLPEVMREEATALLSPADVGNFLVRLSSSREEDLALTVRGVDSCLHFSISVRGSHFSVSNSRHAFSTLTDLILFYSSVDTDMPQSLAMPRFLFTCSYEQLQHYSRMRSEFWRNYQSIQSEMSVQSPLIPHPVITLANQRRRGDSDCPTVQHSFSNLPQEESGHHGESCQQPRSLSMDDVRVPYQPASPYHRFLRPHTGTTHNQTIQGRAHEAAATLDEEAEMETLTRRSVSRSLQRLNSISSTGVTENNALVAGGEYDFLWQTSHQSPGPSSTETPLLPTADTAAAYPTPFRRMSCFEGGDVTPLAQSPYTSPDSTPLPRTHFQSPQPSTSARVSLYDNYHSQNKSDATIYCTPWDQGSALTKAVSQLRAVIQSNTSANFSCNSSAAGQWSGEPSLQRSRSVPLQDQHTNSDDVFSESAANLVSTSPEDTLSSKVAPTYTDSGRSTMHRRVGEDIRQFIQDLVSVESSLFCQNIQLFVKCTLEGSKSDPDVVMRNVRQFLTGLRNYLLSSERSRLNAAVAKELPKLRRGEFLNVEGIFECVLARIVVKPLKDFIYRLIYDKCTNEGTMRTFSAAINKAQNWGPAELGVRQGVRLPQRAEMAGIQQSFQAMIQSYSPLKKLECLLKAAEIMYRSITLGSMSHNRPASSIGADDFLPVFVFCLCRCRVFEALLEAEFMQGLLGPSILRGEAAYYLTTMQAAVELLRSLVERPPNLYFEDITQRGTVQVLILDDVNDSVTSKVFPLRNSSSVRDLCNMIAHAMNIFNPLDYSLFQYADNEERHLTETERPMQLRSSYQMRSKKPCMFVYKRTHSFIVMPVPARCEPLPGPSPTLH